jgi:hypothetical protein
MTYFNFEGVSNTFNFNIEGDDKSINLYNLLIESKKSLYDTIKDLITTPITEENKEKLKRLKISILITEKSDDFLEKFEDNEISDIHNVLSKIIYLLFNIVKIFNSVSLRLISISELKRKIRNTIYINVIKNGILSIENSKGIINNDNIIGTIIRRVSDSVYDKDLIGLNPLTDGIIHNDFNLSIYDLYILNLLLLNVDITDSDKKLIHITFDEI